MALAVTPAAWAQSNIALSQYPGPTCTRPQMPAEPNAPAPQRRSRAGTEGADYNPAEVEAYNKQVHDFNAAAPAFNKAVADFNACMKSYIDNGNADMQRIKLRLDQAVAEANAR